MRRWHGFALVICGGATALIVWQSRELARAEAATQPAAMPVSDEPAPAAPQPELSELRERTRDLPRLRNEARQLRAQKAEMGSERVENTRLLVTKQSGKPVKAERFSA